MDQSYWFDSNGSALIMSAYLIFAGIFQQYMVYQVRKIRLQVCPSSYFPDLLDVLYLIVFTSDSNLSTFFMGCQSVKVL